MAAQDIVDSIRDHRSIDLEQLTLLLTTKEDTLLRHLFEQAHSVMLQHYGSRVFMRGLIEISNHCKNDCRYCGIRRSQEGIRRYRLTEEEILDCCQQGYTLGFRTFVLQGGEDAWFDDEKMCAIVHNIRQAFTDCAITLSLGERSHESYRRLFEAGANRYLLRHETADETHYRFLHPDEMSFRNRMQCLEDLKAIGYQVGCGMMVGSPGQTLNTLLQDLLFIRRFEPAMVGIGPFIPATGTPLASFPAGSVDTTLRLLAIIRLLLPAVLLPATTALGTLAPQGREQALLAGANVIMPNLSPQNHRKEYSIYDNKLATDSEAAESAAEIRHRLQDLGREAPPDRGDWKSEL